MELDNNPVSASSVARSVHINGALLSENYKEHLSDYHDWDQKGHCEDWILFPYNIGKHLCLDETSLTQGELSTLLTNADAKTQKGCLVAVVDGAKCSDIVTILTKIPLEDRLKVEEVSVDMANNMENAAKECFPNAAIVTDRFHVAKLVGDAVQHIRIGERWIAIDEETDKIKKCKKQGKKYVANTYINGDTKKQLLARSRYLLFKSRSKWSKSQQIRAEILFKNFPNIEAAYNLSMMFRNIYELAENKEKAEEKYLDWKKKVAEKIKLEERRIKKNVDYKQKKERNNIRRGLDVFNTVVNSIEGHKENIFNFFKNRTTNALAECFNSKVKAFRKVFRGVRDLSFFLYRVSMIFS